MLTALLCLGWFKKSVGATVSTLLVPAVLAGLDEASEKSLPEALVNNGFAFLSPLLVLYHEGKDGGEE